MKTETSNADKTLIKKVVTELIKQNTLRNEKTLQDFHSFEILKMLSKYHMIKLYLIHHQY